NPRGLRAPFHFDPAQHFLSLARLSCGQSPPDRGRTMSWKNTEHRYGSLSIALHWLMLVLIAGVYACIELKGNFPKGSETRELLKQWHFMLGLSVFVLVWLRLLARALSPAPAIEPAPPGWQHLLAKLMHLALYALLTADP